MEYMIFSVRFPPGAALDSAQLVLSFKKRIKLKFPRADFLAQITLRKGAQISLTHNRLLIYSTEKRVSIKSEVPSTEGWKNVGDSKRNVRVQRRICLED